MATLPFVSMVTTSRFVVNIHDVYSWHDFFFVWIWISDLFTHEVDPDLDPDPDKWCSVNGAIT